MYSFSSSGRKRNRCTSKQRPLSLHRRMYWTGLRRLAIITQTGRWTVKLIYRNRGGFKTKQLYNFQVQKQSNSYEFAFGEHVFRENGTWHKKGKGKLTDRPTEWKKKTAKTIVKFMMAFKDRRCSPSYDKAQCPYREINHCTMYVKKM